MIVHVHNPLFYDCNVLINLIANCGVLLAERVHNGGSRSMLQDFQSGQKGIQFFSVLLNLSIFSNNLTSPFVLSHN